MVAYISLPCVQVAGSMEKPPALITITDAYDSLPVSVTVHNMDGGVVVCESERAKYTNTD